MEKQGRLENKVTKVVEELVDLQVNQVVLVHGETPVRTDRKGQLDQQERLGNPVKMEIMDLKERKE